MRRSWVERLLRPVRPRPDPAYLPEPVPVADGVWQLERRLVGAGLRIPANTTLLRLSGGGLVVVSPPACDEISLGAVQGLGSVEALVAPNPFHYLHLAAWARALPDAGVFAPRSLGERVDSLPAHALLPDATPPTWADALDVRVYGPVRGYEEVVFLHRPSRTLVLTDLAFQMRFERRIDRIVWRLNGAPRGFGHSRTVRLTLLADRAAAGRELASLLQWDFERIAVAHGDPVTRDARATFERAFAGYLPQAS